MENFKDRGVWIRNRFSNFSGSGSSFQGLIRIRFVLRGWIRIQYLLLNLSKLDLYKSSITLALPLWFLLDVIRFRSLKRSSSELWSSCFLICTYMYSNFLHRRHTFYHCSWPWTGRRWSTGWWGRSRPPWRRVSMISN